MTLRRAARNCESACTTCFYRTLTMASRRHASLWANSCSLRRFHRKLRPASRGTLHSEFCYLRLLRQQPKAWSSVKFRTTGNFKFKTFWNFNPCHAVQEGVSRRHSNWQNLPI